MRGALRAGYVGGAHIGLGVESVSDKPPILDPADHRLHFGMIEAEHRKSVEWYILDEALERRAHALESAVEIKMIGIDVGDDRIVAGSLRNVPSLSSASTTTHSPAPRRALVP